LSFSPPTTAQKGAKRLDEPRDQPADFAVANVIVMKEESASPDWFVGRDKSLLEG
tara:strand:+ start:1120 stop:1284 length:165 start_codon:yes stop_codon:yes gene_type:complete